MEDNDLPQIEEKQFVLNVIHSVIFKTNKA